METEAKGWSVPTCSQEAPWRQSEEALKAACAQPLPPQSQVQELAAPHANLILCSNCPQSLVTPGLAHT